jgi:hypothetical protein
VSMFQSSDNIISSLSNALVICVVYSEYVSKILTWKPLYLISKKSSEAIKIYLIIVLVLDMNGCCDGRRSVHNFYLQTFPSPQAIRAVITFGGIEMLRFQGLYVKFSLSKLKTALNFIPNPQLFNINGLFSAFLR